MAVADWSEPAGFRERLEQAIGAGELSINDLRWVRHMQDRAEAAAAERKQYEDRITFIESLASDAKAAVAGYPEKSAAWIDMTARYEAYMKAAAIARGETGGEGWGEP